MKKITSIRQLQNEQESLEIRQAYIESALTKNWLRIKQHLSIGNLANETLYSLISSKKSSPKELTGLIKESLYMGATEMVRQWIKTKI